MDAIERVLKAVNHEEADRIPSFEASIDNISILQYYGENYYIEGAASAQKLIHNLLFGNKKIFNRMMKKLANSSYFSKLLVKNWAKLYRKLGLDICPQPTICLYPEIYHKDGIVDEFGRNMQYKTNPTDGMTLLYYMGGYFTNYEEFCQFPKLNPDNPMREKMFRLGKQIEKENNHELFMLPSIMGMMESTWEAFGLQNFSKLLAHPQEIKKVFDDRGKFAVELTKRVVEWGEENGILIYDDYGYKKGLFMNPHNYQEYVIPWLKRICDIAHKAGLKVFLHSCGDDYLLLEDIIGAGVDALHPIEPTTANPDYNIFKLKKKYGDKLCFIGNVSPQDLSDKDPTFIRQYTKKLIQQIGPGGGFILSSGHSINPAVKLENYLAMRDTLDKLGSYPIAQE